MTNSAFDTDSELALQLAVARQKRLRSEMVRLNIPTILTSDPTNILYGCGARNMTVFGMMGPSRLMLLFAEGPCVLFEFAGCDHLAEGLPTIDVILPAPGLTYTSGAGYLANIGQFSTQVAALCRPYLGRESRLAIERLDFPVTDSLRSHGFDLIDAGPIFSASRIIKLPIEIDVMRIAVARVQAAVEEFELAVDECRTENETWATLHRGLIATGGEYVSTRLMQSGPRTFPYFKESSARQIEPGDLVCLDTDCLGYLGYGVDFSRTYVAGGAQATSAQRQLHAIARNQLDHNSALLQPGTSYEVFARSAFSVPEKFAPYGYYCLGHGLGISGEHPNIPLYVPGEKYKFDGQFEAGMVICVESYIGDPESRQGFKVEDQFLVTPTGHERLTTANFGIAS